MARFYFEQLELRCVMDAGWHNAAFPTDVDGSELVSPLDALIIVNDLNLHSARSIAGATPRAGQMVDVNDDTFVTPLDALTVINQLNQFAEEPSVSSSIVEGDLDANGIVQVPTITIEGNTWPNQRVELKTNGRLATTTVADLSGAFTFLVELDHGLNTVEIYIRDALGRVRRDTYELTRADVVLNWNASALGVVRAWTGVSNDPYLGRIVPSQPPLVARNLAMIHTAMFDAINAVEGNQAIYMHDLPNAPAGSSTIAAAAGAAYVVSKQLYREADELAIWENALRESLETVPDGQAKQQGLDFGRSVGEAMLARRANDGASGPSSYSPSTEPGKWNRTYPDFLPPLLPQWRNVEPFMVQDVAALRPGPPPLITSQEYAEAVDSVMSLGHIDSTTRTQDQTDIAVFWADGGGTATPPGHWNRIAASLAAEQDLTLTETARIFSLLNLAMADAGIAAWDTKYEYDYWRPIDAIRRASEDQNELTIPDTEWLPLLKTPPFPSYVSGHSTFSAAAATILTSIFGDEFAFETSIDPQDAPSQRPLAAHLIVSRQFGSFWAAAQEAGQSRIYGGIHFSFDNIEGLELGSIVGDLTLTFVASFRSSEISSLEGIRNNH